jgi:hypothetical protein
MSCYEISELKSRWIGVLRFFVRYRRWEIVRDATRPKVDPQYSRSSSKETFSRRGWRHFPKCACHPGIRATTSLQNLSSCLLYPSLSHSPLYPLLSEYLTHVFTLCRWEKKREKEERMEDRFALDELAVGMTLIFSILPYRYNIYNNPELIQLCIVIRDEVFALALWMDYCLQLTASTVGGRFLFGQLDGKGTPRGVFFHSSIHVLFLGYLLPLLSNPLTS